MLDTLRRSSRSFLVYIFFAIIIVVFVFSFGPSSGGCQSTTSQSSQAAIVNGEAISLRSYFSTKERWEQAYNISGAQSEALQNMVINNLVQERLLAQEAARRGIAVPEKEIEKTILSKPYYSDARDLQDLRERVRRIEGIPFEEYEKEVYRELSARKMWGLVLGSVVVSEDEVKAQYVYENEKIDLELVRFSPSYFQTQIKEVPSKEATSEFIKTNSARIKESYESQKSRYNKPKRVKARHILIKVEENAPSAAVAGAEQKILALRKKIVSGAEFAAVAKESTEDAGTKERGGDLGAFAAGVMDPAFEKAAFSLKPGEISQPVRSRFGFHLIEVQEILPEESKSLEAVQEELAKEIMVNDSAKAMAKAKAEETLAKVKQGEKLEELWPAPKTEGEDSSPQLPHASKLPVVETTGPTTFSTEFVPRIGVSPSLVQTLVKLNETNPLPDQVFEVNGDFFVLRLRSRSRPDMKAFDAQKEELYERARQRKAGEQIEALVNSLREQAQIEMNETLFPKRGKLGASFDG